MGKMKAQVERYGLESDYVSYEDYADLERKLNATRESLEYYAAIKGPMGEPAREALKNIAA